MTYECLLLRIIVEGLAVQDELTNIDAQRPRYPTLKRKKSMAIHREVCSWAWNPWMVKESRVEGKPRPIDKGARGDFNIMMGNLNIVENAMSTM